MIVLKKRFIAECFRYALALCLMPLCARASPACKTHDYFWTLEGSSAFYDTDGPKWTNNDGRGPYSGGDAGEWIGLMRKNNLPSHVDSNYHQCDYKTAIAAFAALEEDGVDQAGRMQWLDNQDKILTMCAGGGKAVEWRGNLSRRLAREAEYQKAAAAYYSGDTDELNLMKSIAYSPGHPRQADALRSYLRDVYRLDGLEAFWDASEKARLHPATQALWPRIEDVRFEIMTKARENNGAAQDSQAVQEKIIPWLLSVIYEVPKSKDRAEPSRRDDALANLQRYLPAFYEGSKVLRLDWWLSDDPVDSEMLSAARQEAKKSNLLSLMLLEAIHREVNLTRLYDPDNPVRAQQRHLSEYALQKYLDCGGPEWLVHALSMAQKDQASLPRIITLSARVLDDAVLIRMQPGFRLRLWSELIKADLLSGREDEAFDLLQRKDVFAEYPYDQGDVRSMTFIDAVEWFVHQGRYDKARRFFTLKNNFATSYSDSGIAALDLQIYGVMLADTKDGFLSALAGLSPEAAADNRMTPVYDLLPARALLALANAINVRFGNIENVKNLRQHLAKTALTRAWLLNDRALLEDAARALDRYDMTGDRAILNAIDGDPIDVTLFFLKHPRMRIAGPAFDLARAWSALDIDSDNPNDNNWWCRLDPEKARKDLTQRWAIMPVMLSSGFGGIHPNDARFADDRAKAIAAHPLQKLIDGRELRDLQALPSGTELLSRQAIGYSGWPGAIAYNRLRGDRRAPEALALAVRTTRYGCRRNGPHTAYSQKAYRILQRYYSETAWARSTPYWYR